MKDRIREIYNTLEDKLYLKKEVLNMFKNKSKTARTLEMMYENMYLFVYEKYIHKAPCSSLSLYDINSRYAFDRDKFVTERLDCLSKNMIDDLKRSITIPEWMYIIKNKGINIVTKAYIGEVSQKSSHYINNMFRFMHTCGYMTKLGNKKYEINDFVPNMGSKELEDQYYEALKKKPLTKAQTKVSKRQLKRKKAEKVDITEKDRLKALSLAKWMNPESKAEEQWMARIFLKSIYWGKNS